MRPARADVAGHRSDTRLARPLHAVKDLHSMPIMLDRHCCRGTPAASSRRGCLCDTQLPARRQLRVTKAATLAQPGARVSSCTRMQAAEWSSPNGSIGETSCAHASIACRWTPGRARDRHRPAGGRPRRPGDRTASAGGPAPPRPARHSRCRHPNLGRGRGSGPSGITDPRMMAARSSGFSHQCGVEQS